MKKRILAILIAITLIISVIPNSVFAFDCSHENKTELFNNPSTCNSNGSAFYRCNDCGHTWLDQLPTVAHTYVNGTCAVCGWLQIWDEPAVEETTAPAETEHVHTWIDHAEVKPGCATEGNIAYQQCESCGAAQTAGENPLPLGKFGWVLGPTGEHSWYVVEELLPTCVEDGYIFQKCSECGLEENHETLATNMHIIENGKCVDCGKEMAEFNCAHENTIIEAQLGATCSMQGFILNKCTDCRLTWTDILPVADHDYQDCVCTFCGLECVDHNFVVVEELLPTCIEDGYVFTACSICDYHHNYPTEATNMHIVENGKCVTCGREQATFNCEHTNSVIEGQEAATCTMEGFILHKCNDCRLTWTEILPVIKHAYVDGVCGGCGAVCENHDFVTIYEKAATCIDYGYVQQVCSICEYHHNWSPEPINMHIVENGKCVDCGREMAEFHCDHINTEILAEAASTCDMEGYKLYLCNDCRLTWLDILAPHNWNVYEAIAPSCNAEGNIAYKQCADCGEAWTLDENPLPLSKYGWVLGPTGVHTLEHHEAVAPTCTENGHEAFDYCTTCQCFFYADPLKLTYQAGIILPTGEHVFETVFEKEPTCVEHGYVQQVCTLCGYEHNWSPDPINIHIIEDGKCIHCGREMAAFNCDHSNNIVLGQEAASCTMQGFILYQCDDCKQTWLEILPVIAHAYVDGICTGCGAVCENHNFVTIFEKEATCVDYGYVQQECTICGYEHNWSPEPTNMHIIEGNKCTVCGREFTILTCDHKNYTVEGQEAATCTMQGWILNKCNDCRQTWTEILPVIDHAYEHGICTICGAECTEHNWVTIFEKEPTCVEYGYVQQECSICGNEQNWSPDPINMHIVENGKCVDCGREMAEFNCDHANAVIVTEAASTCDMEGYKLYMCNDCRLTWVEVLAPHSWNVYEAVAPSCNAEGNIAYKQCADCGEAWTLDENPLPLSKFGWVLGPTGEHTMEKYEAVVPTCDTDGHDAFEYCTTCECFFYADPLKLTYQAGVIPALGHTWTEYEAVAPSCNAEGNIAYAQCSVCGAAQTIGENPMPLSMYGWVLGPTGEHTFEHHDAVAATCDENGHEAFDYCTTCECFFYADPLKLTYQAGIILATGHSYVQYAAVEPTCDTEGNIAYEQCSVCGAAQTLGENPMPLSKFGWVLGATGHTWVEYAAVAPTCDTEGNIAYAQCAVCGAAQTLGENPMPLSKYGWILGATGHTWVDVEAVAPTCDTDGNIAYQYCSACGAAQTAGENPLPLAKDRWVLSAIGHTWVDVAAVAPTCDTEGNVAYQYCSVCGAAQTAGENPMPLSKYGWILGATGHAWVEHEAVEPTCDKEGNIAYAQCSVCGAAQTLGENPMPLSKYGWVLGPIHDVKHVEAKAATTEAEGNVEYWFCEDCGYAWLDEAQTKVTNLKSVIIPKAATPATGDNTPVVLLVVVMAVAVLAVAILLLLKKRGQTK